MRKLLFSVLAGVFALGACTSPQSSQQKTDYTQLVNPFIGTDFTGNTYPGAQAPFGMVQLSPDNGLAGWDRISGYFYPDSTIAGFSHTHLSGTGAGDLYDILFMPVTLPYKEVAGELGIHSKFSHQDEEASAGYYRVKLQDYNINVELTATPRCGVQRYTFPKAESMVVLNLKKAMNWDFTMDSQIEVVDSCNIRGYRFSEGWARGQKVYFATRFSKPFKNVELDNAEIKLKGEKVGTSNIARFMFDTEEGEQITIVTALSGVSVEGAVGNPSILYAVAKVFDRSDVLCNLLRVKGGAGIALLIIPDSNRRLCLGICHTAVAGERGLDFALGDFSVSVKICLAVIVPAVRSCELCRLAETLCGFFGHAALVCKDGFGFAPGDSTFLIRILGVSGNRCPCILFLFAAILHLNVQKLVRRQIAVLVFLSDIVKRVSVLVFKHPLCEGIRSFLFGLSVVGHPKVNRLVRGEFVIEECRLNIVILHSGFHSKRPAGDKFGCLFFVSVSVLDEQLDGAIFVDNRINHGPVIFGFALIPDFNGILNLFAHSFFACAILDQFCDCRIDIAAV